MSDVSKKKTKVGAACGKGIGWFCGGTKEAAVKSYYGTLGFFQDFGDGWKEGVANASKNSNEDQ